MSKTASINKDTAIRVDRLILITSKCQKRVKTASKNLKRCKKDSKK